MEDANVKVRLTIYDNDIPRGSYELLPSRIDEYGVTTKYIFKFEYNQLKCEKQELRKGHWISIPYFIEYESDAKCSECLKIFVDAIDYDYCPGCGAKMEKYEG